MYLSCFGRCGRSVAIGRIILAKILCFRKSALNVSSTGIDLGNGAPPSREDALAARLRDLRNSRSSPSPGPLSQQQQQQPHDGREESADPPPPYTEGDARALLPRQPSGARVSPVKSASASSVSASASAATAPAPQAEAGGGDELDELLGAGGPQSLDDILEGLDVEDDQWLRSHSSDGGDDAGSGRGDESARVEELLAKLQDDPPFQIVKAESRDWQTGEGDEEAADDSEGEAMKREIDNVIAQALDGVHLDESMPPEEKSDEQSGSEAGKRAKRDADMSLPSAPTKLRDESEDDASSEAETSTDEDTSGDDSSEGDAAKRAARRKQKGKKKRTKLKLPDAPVRIWDPAASAEKNFDTDIARRMAFLKRLEGRLEGSLEMPSAPTFKPEDKPGKGPL